MFQNLKLVDAYVLYINISIYKIHVNVKLNILYLLSALELLQAIYGINSSFIMYLPESNRI